MKKISVLLIYASFYSFKDLPERKRIFWEPLGIAYLTAYLRSEGYHVDILYPLIEDLDIYGIEKKLQCMVKHYDLIGLSSPSSDISDVDAYVKMIKSCDFKGKIILGGLGPTCNWREFLLTGVDVVIIGEGEKTLLKILKMLEDGGDIRTIFGVGYIGENGLCVRNGNVELIENLDENVFPARDISVSFLLKTQIQQVHIQIQTSRGCMGQCSFCSICKYLEEQGGVRYRSRSAKSVVDEIEWLNAKYGFTKFDFMDENFFPFDKSHAIKKAMELISELKYRKLSITLFIQCHMQAVSAELLDLLSNDSINVNSIFVGIDSFQQKELFLFNKRYKREDTFDFLKLVSNSKFSFNVDSLRRVKTGFINFTPISTLDSLEENAMIFKKYGLSCKKLMRRLNIHVENELLIRRLLKLFPEYASNHYFMNEKVQKFYDKLIIFYNCYERVRGKLRNIENAYSNDSNICSRNEVEKVSDARMKLDDSFYDYYFTTLHNLKCGKEIGDESDAFEKMKSIGDDVGNVLNNSNDIDWSISYPLNDRGV